MTELKNLTIVTNGHGIDLIQFNNTGKYPVRISLKKCASILNTNNDGTLIKPVKFKGRDLFEITHMDGKGKFKVGEKKMKAVLENGDAVMSLMQAVIKEAQNATA